MPSGRGGDRKTGSHSSKTVSARCHTSSHSGGVTHTSTGLRINGWNIFYYNFIWIRYYFYLFGYKKA